MTIASTEKDPTPKTEVVDIKGRDVEIRPLNDAQAALMAREIRIMGKSGMDGKRRIDAVARMFSILESVVVSDEDREYMDDLIIAGKLDLRELTSFVTVFRDDEGEEEEEKPKVRRGRPPVKRA